MYHSNEEIRRAIDLIRTDFFNLNEPGIFQPIVSTLLEHGDFYMHLADLPSFIEAQSNVDQLYRDQESWTEKAIINIARTGRFSADRTIREYAKEIWKVEPVNVEE